MHLQEDQSSFGLVYLTLLQQQKKTELKTFAKLNTALIGSGHTHTIKRINHSHHRLNKLLNE